ncbi:hypothetical protein IW261DRAFT_1562705 [Armillaria novae-zelandiae]|uniref:Mid2 domain-containing protein n=1 Tax=Armillaria novae-zelandiae TaxID=153914 RepID=A0AA39PD50_9AGAR|nr:hypothetical protein IW261DRAFT_1562705 [Armillaria novae-zelandiae]
MSRLNSDLRVRHRHHRLRPLHRDLTGVRTATSSANSPPSPTPSGKGNNGDGSSSGEGPSPQDPAVTDSSTPTQTHGSGNQGSSPTPTVPGSSSTPTQTSGSGNQGSSPTSAVPGSSPTPTFSSEGKHNDGPASGHGSSTIFESTPNSTEVPDSKGTTPNGTPASTDHPLPASMSTGGTNATPNSVGPTDQPRPVSSGVAHPPNAPSHSDSGLPKGTGGLTSLTHASIGPTTVSDHQTSSSATTELDVSSSSIPLLVHNSGPAEFSTYTTTFTSLKTFFELTTMTTAPPPTTMTTFTPYSTSTELITSTIVVSVTTTARSSSRPSKAQIGGIVAGTVGFFALLVAILIYLIRRKRKRMDFVLVSPT